MTNTFRRLRFLNHVPQRQPPAESGTRQLEAASGAAGTLADPDIPDGCPAERFLTVPEVATILGVSAKTVCRRLRTGLLRKAPLGGRIVRIAAAELARFAGG